jgi:NDP-sugar pyrophosphorylase family protein
MTKHVLIMGFGHHARRIYYPILESEKNKFDYIIIDLHEQKESIEDFLATKLSNPVEIVLIDQFAETLADIPFTVETKLDKIKRKYSPEGIIISTDPSENR